MVEPGNSHISWSLGSLQAIPVPIPCVWAGLMDRFLKKEDYFVDSNFSGSEVAQIVTF